MKWRKSNGEKRKIEDNNRVAVSLLSILVEGSLPYLKMASVSFAVGLLPYASVRFPVLSNANSLKLSSSASISTPILQQKLCSLLSPLPLSPRPRPLTIVSAKGYKMKTHKVALFSLSHLFFWIGLQFMQFECVFKNGIGICKAV